MYLIMAREDSVPLWKVALFRNFETPYKIVLRRKTIIACFLATQGGKRKKNTDTQFGTKEAEGPESKGTKKAQTAFTQAQFKKTMINCLPARARGTDIRINVTPVT